MITEIQFDQILKLQVGERLLIKVANKRQQNQLAKWFDDMIIERYLINPELFSQLQVTAPFEDGRLFVAITRGKLPSHASVVVKEDGTKEVVIPDVLRKRKLFLMIKDGLSEKEINDLLEGGLDDEEKKLFSQQ